MQIQNTIIVLIKDGTFRLDGGVLFGQIDKTQWETFEKPDRRNRITLGLNSILIDRPDKKILIDTGIGAKRSAYMKDNYNLNGNRLIRSLKAHGLTAKDIDIVVLTNLQFHHSGGCTKLDRSGTAVPVFTRAKHIVQKAAWDAAQNPNERYAHYFYEDDYEPLAEREMIELIDGEEEIVPGVTVKPMWGPSQGNQAVFIEYGSERLIYAGDLIPTHHHIPVQHIPATAEFPNDTLVQKRELLQMAMERNWRVIFGNGNEFNAAYMKLYGSSVKLEPAEI